MNTQTIMIVVASKDLWKTEAVWRAATRAFPSRTVVMHTQAVDEDDDQPPLQDYFAMIKARQRANLVRREYPLSDYCIGSESAIQCYDTDELIFDWVVSRSLSGLGLARSAATPVPAAVRELYRGGVKFSEAFQRIFGSVPRGEQGMVGILTRDKITRTSLYESAVILALTGSIPLAPGSKKTS